MIDLRNTVLTKIELKNQIRALEFEKKLCRSTFKKNFGLKLPHACSLSVSVAACNEYPDIKSSKYRDIKNSIIPINITSLAQKVEVEKSEEILYPFEKKGFASPSPLKALRPATRDFEKIYHKYFNCSGLQFTNAGWILQMVKKALSEKRNPQKVLNLVIRDFHALMRAWQNKCPIKGIRILVSGRLGRKRKGMAKQISVCAGHWRLGTIKEKIDYSQDFSNTRLGCVGIKVWLCLR